MTKTSGCFTVISNKKDQILLTKRKDYPIWDLPGGTCEKGELLEDCARRETEEETGYSITINKKIGEYYQPQYDDMQHLFSGEILGGSPIIDGPETAKVEWFNPNNLPLLMVPNRRKQIKNYLKHRDVFVEKSIIVSQYRIYFFKKFLRVLSKK